LILEQLATSLNLRVKRKMLWLYAQQLGRVFNRLTSNAQQLKLIRISRFQIIVTHQDKAEDNNKLKKYNTTQLQNLPYCILYIKVSLLSRHAKLSNLEDHMPSLTEIQ